MDRRERSDDGTPGQDVRSPEQLAHAARARGYAPALQFRTLCAHFGTPGGCRWGDMCTYIHTHVGADRGRLPSLGSDDGWGPSRTAREQEQDRSQRQAPDVAAWRTAIPTAPVEERAAPPPRATLQNEPRLRRSTAKTPKPRPRAPKTPAPQSTKPAPVLVEGSRPVRHAMEEIVARLKNEKERRGQESPSTRSRSAPSALNGSSVAGRLGRITTPRGLEPPSEAEEEGWPSPFVPEDVESQQPATPAPEANDWPTREETPALVVTDIEVAPGSRPDEIAAEWSRRGVVESVEIVKVVARVVWRPFHE